MALQSFIFDNFKSFKGENVFNLAASPITEHKESLIELAGHELKLLPVCVIYGPNGSGKSNVIKALFKMHSLVIKPILQAEFLKEKWETLSGDSFESIMGNQNLYQPVNYIKNQNSGNDNSSFEIHFQIEKNTYVYKCEIDSKYILLEEFGKVLDDGIEYLFKRKASEVWLHKKLEAVNTKHLGEGVSLLSYCSMFADVKEIDDGVTFFLKMCPIESCCFREPSEGELISSGEKRLKDLQPHINDALKSGKILLIDGLDDRLHPDVLCEIVNCFTDPKINKHKAQLLFTAHDVIIMNNEMFRRDEIFFTSKKDGNSKLYSLVDYRKENGDKPRKDETYYKQYLEGRYGTQFGRKEGNI